MSEHKSPDSEQSDNANNNNGKTAGVSLRLRRVDIDTYQENVVFMHRNCETYRAEGFRALNKVVVSAGGHRIYAVLNVVDDENIVATDEIGLSEQAFDQLEIESGTPVTVEHAETPPSMEAVRHKIAGWRLTYEDLRAITRDIADNRYSRMEMAAFLVAAGEAGLDREEILHLTRAMTESGQHLQWDEPQIVDKHCIGGIPGNRTSMLVVPIVAAHGMYMPKTSSRAITSPAGTADTMEILAEVNLTPRQIHEVVRKEHGCLAWGGRARLAPVDDKLISVERPLGIDAPGQMVASILSKKLAAGSTHLLLDIPVGPTAKVRHMNEALHLRKLFEYIGDRLGIYLEVIITDGSQPVGRGVGPVLEARDILMILDNDPDAPNDLKQKALRLAGRVLEFDPDVRGGYGYDLARDILESGRAKAKMERIVRAQGKKPIDLEPGHLATEITAEDSGFVTAIDNQQVNRIASLAGAPGDRKAGVYLMKKLGDPVERGEALYRVHAQYQADFDFAVRLAKRNTGYTIGPKAKTQRGFPEV